jgi:tRNA (mo5U34)-methyltransferase
MGRRWRRPAAPDPKSEGLDAGPPGRLVVPDELPTITATKHDPARALDFFRVGPDPAPPTASAPDARSELQRAVDAIGWYHTIELPGGVVTPGQFDHRELLARYPLPARLNGSRALDVATFDGFWAFELERRGADVIAVDVACASMLDLPAPAEAQRRSEGIDAETGGGFRIAHEALGSKVRRVSCSVYDLDPAELGTFDFVHMADLLLHLRSPVEGLAGIRRVTTGQALVTDVFHPGLARPGTHLVEYRGGWDRVLWWLPSLHALAQMVLDAGFAEVQVGLVYNLAQRTQTHGLWRAALLAQA